MRGPRRATSSTHAAALRAALLVALAAPVPLAAQGGTDIWVASFTETGTHIAIGRPVNVTRRAGYDNQPSFTADGRALHFTSIREDAQADIWRVPVTGGAPVRVTDTPESEYSATRTPDGLAISVIRVERDSTQRLWRFPLDGGAPSLVLRALRPVGYHVWVGDHTLGTFVLGAPNALVLVDARTERADTLARRIGRALVRIPGRDAFSFVQEGDTAWISEVDVRTRTVQRIAPAPPQADYHLWTPAGQLIAASGSRIWLRVGARWDLLADFAELGVRGITRLALSAQGDRLAFVAEDPGSP
ncbi:MAG: PD40 domain-containing protein [Gemmatimonadetes bacterium]|nr:PD40 domain-containing protein [Gemmatimonadota bacterium]